MILLMPLTASAQRLSLGTDILSWAELGTINLEAGYALNKNWSVTASAGLNPWKYNKGNGYMANKEFTISAGARYWFWFSNSGWFAETGGKYSIFNKGGIFSNLSKQGYAAGISVSGGYSLILSKHWNMEFGIGFFTGYSDFRTYECADCGRFKGRRSGFSIWPDEFNVQIVYIF